MRKIALALLAALLPSLAAAQVPSTLPANTVLGRLGVGAGPVQAIPFATLGPTLLGTGLGGGVLAGLTPAFTATPTLGVASSLSGSLTFARSANSGTVTLQAPSTSTTYTITFPTTACSNGQGWVSDGSGNMSCSATSGTVNSGTSGQLGYYAASAAAISGNANLTVSAGALTLGVANSVQGSLLLSGSAGGATTLAGPTSSGGTWTFQSGSDTVVGRATTDTLTNKTLTSPTVNTPTIAGGTHTAITGLGIRDTSAAFDVTVAATSTSAALTAGRTLTLDMGNVAHTVKFGTTANTITFPNVASDTVTMLTSAQTLTTKTITGSTYEGLTISTTTGTFTLTNGKTLAAQNTMTLAAGADGQTFTFPSSTDTIVGLAASQTLTNKTLTSPTINGGTHTAITGLGIRSSGSGAFDLTLANTENLTAGRTLTLTLENASRTIDLSGNLTLAGAFSTAGAFAITLTATGTTNVTLPTSGTLAVQNAVNTFSSTNTFSAVQQFTDIKFSSGKLYPTANSTTALQITEADASTVLINADTTNRRIGINKTTPAADLDVSGTIAFSTLDATSLSTSTSTITGLTANNSPTAANDYAMYYSAADGRIRKITLSALTSASVAGVSSVNGLTGGLTVASTGQANTASSGTTVTIAVPDTYSIQNCSLAASVGSNLLTVAVKDNTGADPSATSPCRIPFRSSTASTGSWTIDSVTSALSISTNSTGATLGSANSTAFRFWVVAFDNAGTPVLALYNASSTTACTTIDESVVQSSTAISGSATSAATFYTPNGTTLSSKAIRILGYVEYNSSGLATAGTYASAPSFVQTFGPGIHRPCEKWFNNSVTTSSTTTTTSNTFVDTNLTMTVTPKSAANHIGCMASGIVNSASATPAVVTTITRSSTNIGSAAGNQISGNSLAVNLAPYDSPNTTSGTTYKVQIRNTDGTTTVIYSAGSSASYLACDEIQG